MAEEDQQITVFDYVGGAAFFERLVDEFYDRVEADQALLALYPDPTDLGPARRRFRLFLAQYWGGPQTYNEERGHPRLRMRHQPFVIDQAGRDRWMAAMTGALDVLAPEPMIRERFDAYFAMSADAMVNAELQVPEQ